LFVDQLLLTNTAGSFAFPSGTLKPRNMTVANGAPFVVGDGVNSATLELQGGTFSFANGLVISPNATVSGCGTIIGAISNNGTLNTNCNGGVIINSISRQGSTATVNFLSTVGASYTLEFKNSITGAVWTAIPPVIIGDGGLKNAVDTNATNASRFYRLRVQ
jgi:hypothetical protein